MPLEVDIAFRGTRLIRSIDTSEWNAGAVDWLEQGYAGSFPVRACKFKRQIMANPEGRLVVQADGTMVLYDAARREVARDLIAVDQLHYESGIHLVQ